MKQKLTALFDYYWITDREFNKLERAGITLDVYLVNNEPEIRISIDELNNKQKKVLYSMLKKETVEEIKNKEYTWLILYK